MESNINEQVGIQDCWSRIGVWGDGSCPELKRFIHCQNCFVYSLAGRSLLEREAPAGYLNEWTDLLTVEKEVTTGELISVVIFRLGQEWLALAAPLFTEVTAISVVHTLPHRSNDIFLGLVSIRGEIQLCVSLNNLLGLGTTIDDDHPSQNVHKRMVVVERDGNRWVFPVDEIYGVHRFEPAMLKNVPATVSKGTDTFTKAMIKWGDQSVNYLEDELLFYTLSRRIL